jgi:hypothetical protein
MNLFGGNLRRFFAQPHLHKALGQFGFFPFRVSGVSGLFNDHF